MNNVEVQDALRRLGFDPGPSDGRIGPGTREALRAFQRRFGLVADGVPGPLSRAALRQALSGLQPAAGGPLDNRSERSLQGVHPGLVRVVREAATVSPIAFVVTEGLRTVQRQRALVASGASRTMNSRHLTGHAVDLAARVRGEIRWDWPLYRTLSEAMKVSAGRLGVPLEWGGDWRRFRDGPHFQLPFGAD
jgi:peptidoglycan LD-endopeptidase CwlK